jgi:hypothetical protein
MAPRSDAELRALVARAPRTRARHRTREGEDHTRAAEDREHKPPLIYHTGVLHHGSGFTAAGRSRFALLAGVEARWPGIDLSTYRR